MASFTDFNQKAALLLRKLSSARWLSKKDGNPKIPGTEISLNTIRYWREAENTYTDTQIVSDWLKSRLGITDQRNLFSDDIDVKEFTKLLGYEVDQGRKIIDQAYIELYPAYSIFYSNGGTAKSILNIFGRFNFLYRTESNNLVREIMKRDSNIVQMPLILRYPLEGTKSKTEGLFRVRCKLTIPSYTTDTPFFQYDGYIAPQRYGTHYWLFENRNEQNKDLLFMITDYPKKPMPGESSHAQGIMITRRQDDQDVHKVWKIVLLKVEQNDSKFFDPNDTSDPESNFMKSHCKVVSKDDIPSWVVDKLGATWNLINLLSLL